MSKRYDGEPPEDEFEEDEVEFYGGKTWEVQVRGNPMPIPTFPGWIHGIVIGTDKVVECISEDLVEGLAIIQDGRVGLIEGVKPGLWCGLMEGVFLGRPPEDGEIVERKKFLRDIYADGRISWRVSEEKLT